MFVIAVRDRSNADKHRIYLYVSEKYFSISDLVLLHNYNYIYTVKCNSFLSGN